MSHAERRLRKTKPVVDLSKCHSLRPFNAKLYMGDISCYKHCCESNPTCTGWKDLGLNVVNNDPGVVVDHHPKVVEAGPSHHHPEVVEAGPSDVPPEADEATQSDHPPEADEPDPSDVPPKVDEPTQSDNAPEADEWPVVVEQVQPMSEDLDTESVQVETVPCDSVESEASNAPNTVNVAYKVGDQVETL